MERKTWMNTRETELAHLLRDCAIYGFADYSKNEKKLGREYRKLLTSNESDFL